MVSVRRSGLLLIRIGTSTVLIRLGLLGGSVVVLLRRGGWNDLVIVCLMVFVSEVAEELGGSDVW